MPTEIEDEVVIKSTDAEEVVTVEQLDRLEWMLGRDLRKAAADLKPDEVRYLVDLYYQLQRFRISTANAVRSAAGEPNILLTWFSDRIERLEHQVPGAMRVYARGRRDGRWTLSVHGIGPVLAAGLLAQFDITRAPTVGHFWSFAGMNPEQVWAKGTKRPFSLQAKVLCWKVGQSFMKLRGSERDVYGKVYAERKAFEIERNESGAHAGYQLRTSGKTTTVDKLPPFIIDARARRYAVKLFVAHLHHVMHECHFDAPPPKPYILTQPGHAHFIAPPQWPIE